MKKLFTILLAALLGLSAQASNVVFSFTNSSTGQLDTNDFKIIPLGHIRNSDGTFNNPGLPLRIHNQTGVSTNWLVAQYYQITNQFIGDGFFIRCSDSSSNIVMAGDKSIYCGSANPFIEIVVTNTVIIISSVATNALNASQSNVVASAIINSGGTNITVPPDTAAVLHQSNVVSTAAGNVFTGTNTFTGPVTTTNLNLRGNLVMTGDQSYFAMTNNSNGGNFFSHYDIANADTFGVTHSGGEFLLGIVNDLSQKSYIDFNIGGESEYVAKGVNFGDLGSMTHSFYISVNGSPDQLYARISTNGLWATRFSGNGSGLTNLPGVNIATNGPDGSPLMTQDTTIPSSQFAGSRTNTSGIPSYVSLADVAVVATNLVGSGSGLTNLQASGVSTNGSTAGQVMINGGNGTVVWTNNQSVVAAGDGETAETMTTNPVTGQVTYTSNVNTNQFLASTGNSPFNGSAITNLNLQITASVSVPLTNGLGLTNFTIADGLTNPPGYLRAVLVCITNDSCGLKTNSETPIDEFCIYISGSSRGPLFSVSADSTGTNIVFNYCGVGGSSAAFVYGGTANVAIQSFSNFKFKAYYHQ
jgi:hypothetical protein